MLRTIGYALGSAMAYLISGFSFHAMFYRSLFIVSPNPRLDIACLKLTLLCGGLALCFVAVWSTAKAIEAWDDRRRFKPHRAR